MVLYKRYRTLPAANRYTSANASFPAARPVRTGRLWILLLDHIATICIAIEYGYPRGGWAPQGREAEDGCIPLKYQLTGLPDGGYRQRTRRNVEDSDGTLIVNMGELDGGTLATKIFAEKAGKPYYVAQVDDEATDEMAASVLAWLRAHHIKTLNVAEPRESKRPGIYQQTTALLQAVDKALFEDVP